MGDGGHGGFRFPNPHVQLVKIDAANRYALLEQLQIWNHHHAFACPCLKITDRGEVEFTLRWGEGKRPAHSAAGILVDFVVWNPERARLGPRVPHLRPPGTVSGSVGVPSLA